VEYSGIPFLSCKSIHLGTRSEPAGQGSFQKLGKVGQCPFNDKQKNKNKTFERGMVPVFCLLVFLFL